MPKGIHDERYRWLIEQLIRARNCAGLSQAKLAASLGKPQQLVSRYGLGERRLDVVEFIDIAGALELDFASLFVQMQQTPPD